MSRGDLILMSGGSRIGGDELRGDYVPTDLQFSSSWQGGFKTLDLSLARTASAAALERMYGPVRLVDRDGQTVWQGELRRPDARSARGSHATHSPSALGLSCFAEDREDVQWIGVDRDLGRWGPPRREREAMFTGTPLAMAPASADRGALRFDVSGSWASATGRPAAVAVYDGGVVGIGAVFWGEAPSVNVNAGQWGGEVIGQPADGTSGTPTISNWVTGSGAGTPSVGTHDPVFASLGGARMAEINLYTATTPAPELTRTVDLNSVGVLGDHGLPFVGTNASDWGIRASDAIPWLIGRFGAGLAPGFIPTSPFALPHCGQFEPGTLGEAVNALNAYHGYTSAVWERGEWDFHPYGTAPRSRAWKVTLGDPGVEVQEAGTDGSSIWSGVVVSYTGPDGLKRTVGPPGSLAHTHDERLAVADPLNPAVAEGKPRFKRYDLGVTVVEEIAILAGSVYASELNQARRAGTATITGVIYDAETGEPFPSYRARGGDWLTVLNAGDDEPHRLLDASYGDGRATFTLDDGMQYADVLLAHLQGQLIGRL